MLAHSKNFGNNGFVRPSYAKHLSELLEVLCRGLADRKHCVTQPAHAKIVELFIKELDSELTCEKGDMVDDRQSDAPLLVLRKKDDCRYQR